MDFLDNMFDKLENKMELRKWNGLIKKICKKNYIDPSFKQMYLNIQKDILDRINSKDLNVRHKKTHKLFYPLIIIKRVYELNREFPTLIYKEFYHSANALTRQIVELYIKTIYCRLKQDSVKKLLEDLNEKFSDIKGRIEELKRSNINLPYIKNLSKGRILDGLYSDFQYFSDLFHPSSKSFAFGIWTYENDENKKFAKTKLYIETKGNIKNKTILFFPKKTPIPVEQIIRTIHQFYTYSGLILSELKLIDEENAKTKNKIQENLNRNDS